MIQVLHTACMRAHEMFAMQLLLLLERISGAFPVLTIPMALLITPMVLHIGRIAINRDLRGGQRFGGHGVHVRQTISQIDVGILLDQCFGYMSGRGLCRGHVVTHQLDGFATHQSGNIVAPLEDQRFLGRC